MGNHSVAASRRCRGWLVPYLLAAGTWAIHVVPSRAEEAFELAAEGDVRWRRGNLHAHSHWSDGDDYLESIALWYRDQGYDFLAFTDHNVLATSERWAAVEKTKGGRRAFAKLQRNFPDWVDSRTVDGELQVRLRRFDEVAARFNRPERFLLVQGEEISDSAASFPVHMNASNVGELIEPRGGRDVFEAIQNNVRAVLEQRERTGQPMIVHLNHPNYGYAVTAEDLMRVQGERFFEVYNGHPGVNNSGDAQHAGAERMWDVILAHRLGLLDLPAMFGLAVDDGHSYHDIPSRASEPGRGWVMVLSEQLTPESLIANLEAGRFYASSGVALRRIAFVEGRFEVEVDPQPDEQYTIEFVGTRQGADLRGEPVTDANGQAVRATRRYGADVGAVWQTVQGTRGVYQLQGDELYVRARVKSSASHPNPSETGDAKMAWTQPAIPATARGK
jgi:hypothetical protein